MYVIKTRSTGRFWSGQKWVTDPKAAHLYPSLGLARDCAKEVAPRTVAGAEIWTSGLKSEGFPDEFQEFFDPEHGKQQ